MAQDARRLSAEALLNTYGTASLQQMARQWQIGDIPKSKPAVVAILAKRLYSPERIARALEDLEPGERHALDFVIVAAGRMPASVLRGLLEEEGIIEPAAGKSDTGTYRNRGSEKFEDIVARLGALGLAFTTDEGMGGIRTAELSRTSLYLFIPDPILQALPRRMMQTAVAPPPSRELPADRDALFRDVYMLLTFAQDEPIPLTARGQIPKRMLVRIDEAFRLPEGATRVKSEADLGRLPFLRAVMEDLGLLVAGASGLRLGDAAALLALPRGERQLRLYAAYGASERWSELLRLPDVTVKPRTQAFSAAVVRARRRVLGELAQLPPGEWISVAQLVDRLSIRDYEFLLSRSWRGYYYYDSSSYYVASNPYYGPNPLGLSFESQSHETLTWARVEANFIRAVVTEALHWLGVVDLGMEGEEDQRTVFRITPEGAALLHGQAPVSLTQESQVVVQPNFQVFAFEPTGEDVLFTLDRIARRVRAEQVVEYQLTRESIYAAQRAGMDMVEILAFLERVSSSPLPQNVRRTLEEWGVQHERIVIRRGVSLLQSIDEGTFNALSSELAPLLARRLTPTVALIPRDRLRAVYDYLLADGHPLPAVSEGDDAESSVAVTVDEDGKIALRSPLPSIYVLRALHRFADEDSDGTFRLTRGSLQRGAATQPPEGIVETLKRLSGGMLSEATIALIERWAKHWGRGALATVSLLQVETPEIMASLLADPELRPHLRALPGATNLAIVEQERIEWVRELLDERGMDLQGKLQQ